MRYLKLRFLFFFVTGSFTVWRWDFHNVRNSSRSLTFLHRGQSIRGSNWAIQQLGRTNRRWPHREGFVLWLLKRKAYVLIQGKMTSKCCTSEKTAQEKKGGPFQSQEKRLWAWLSMRQKNRKESVKKRRERIIRSLRSPQCECPLPYPLGQECLVQDPHPLRQEKEQAMS